MPNAFISLIIYILVAVAIAGVSFIGGCNHGQLEIKTALEASDKAAAVILSKAKADNEKQRVKNEADKKGVEDKYKSDIDKLRIARATDTKRLRDPYQSSTCPAPAASGDTGTAQTKANGAELSAELDGFLKAEADRADELAVWANACYTWVNRDTLTKP